MIRGAQDPMWRSIVARLVGVAALALAGCAPPCTPDLHPAVRVQVPDVDCETIGVLLSQPDRASLRCTLLQDRGACVAWCGRADLRGAARVRVQTLDGDVIADVSVSLPDTQCPTQPGVELDLAQRALAPANNQ